jgi:hypothetical protein
MKYFLLLIVVLSCGQLFAQPLTVNVILVQRTAPESSDSIYYSPNRKLTWADFKGKPVASSPAAAITNSGFGFGMGTYTKAGKTRINITVSGSFNKSQSWVKPAYANEYVLNHEQHHFDLTWYCTVQFYKKLKAAALTPDNYRDVITRIYTESYTLLRQLQDAYDSETSNGILKDKQALWNKKIDSLLASESEIL